MSKKAIIKRRSDWPCEYLAGIRCFCYGEKVLACYSDAPHMALPLNDEQARVLLPMLRAEFPPSSFHRNDEFDISALSFSIVDYPLQEVSGNE